MAPRPVVPVPADSMTTNIQMAPAVVATPSLEHRREVLEGGNALAEECSYRAGVLVQGLRPYSYVYDFYDEGKGGR